MHCPPFQDLPPPPPGKVGWPWTDESVQLSDPPPNEKLWPKITIITPSLNQGVYIEETIRSVLLQGYPDLEYIVIDGGSSDESVEIIKKYEKYLAHWVSEPDEGQSDAINKGALLATGTLMNWLNADDSYLPNILKVLAIAHCKAPGNLIAGNGIFYGEHTGKTTKVYQSHDQDLIDFINYWSGFKWSGQPCWFFPTKVFKDSEFLDISLHFAMDRDILMRVWKTCSVTYVDNFLVKFRQHSRQKTDKYEIEAIVESMLEVHPRYLYQLSPTQRQKYVVSCMRTLIRLALRKLVERNPKDALKLLGSTKMLWDSRKSFFQGSLL